MRKIAWLSFMLILSSFKKCQQCSIEICLSWKVSFNSLTLICKVNTLEFHVYIYDQFNKEVANCYSDLCDSYHQNASIIFKSNKTIYTVTGHIDNKVNGNWTCRHGTKRDIAQVEVTVLIDGATRLDDQVIDDKKEHRNQSKTVKEAEGNCAESLICYTLVGFVAMLAVFSASNWILERYSNGIPECCRNNFFSSVKKKIDFEELPKSVSFSIFLLFLLLLFGIPILVGFVQDGTCVFLAIPAMIVLGLTLGGTASMVCFGSKINSVTEERTIYDQSAVNPADSDEQGMLMNNHANNNPCDNDGQGGVDVDERSSLSDQTSQV